MFDPHIIHLDDYEIRTLLPEDVGEEYAKWFTDPVVRKFINYSAENPTVESLKAYVEEKLNSEVCLFYGIFDDQGKHLGNIKFEPLSKTLKTAVLGILIGSKGRGSGLGKKVIESTTNRLRANYGINVVELGVDKDNLPAINLYTSLGFNPVSEGILLKNISSKIMQLELDKI